MKLPTLHEIRDHAKAILRGEKRIQPYGVRGRVYQRRNGMDTGPTMPATAKAVWTIKMRIIRADGTIEEVK